MQIKILIQLILLISFAGSAFGVSDLDERMSQYKILQERVQKECINNPRSKKYEIKVDGKKINCDELILITEQLRLQIDKEVAELRACVPDLKPSPHQALASDAGKILASANACEKSPDMLNCMVDFTCTMLAVAPPIKLLVDASSMVVDSSAIKKCATQSNNCLLSVMRGIFDALWSSVSLVWDLAKMGVLKTGELIGLVKKSEAATSDKAMAAQQASPGFLKSMAADPTGTIKTMAKNLYESLEDAAINHYGCEKWAGLPFKSKCVAPMSTWHCGTCAQKTQVYCGIAGYATGEIGTALLTGGLLAGGKAVIVSSIKLSSGPAANVAQFIGKNFPKASEKLTQAAAKMGSLTRTALTAAELKSIAAWDKISNSKTVKVLSEGALIVSKSTVGKASGIALKPIVWYINAMDDAFRLGFNSVEKATAAKLTVSGTNASLIAKYKNDPEYFKLFTPKKFYDEYHDDVATVIMTLERTQPHLTKAEIRQSIEKMMNSCPL